ncbi:MAG: hypothetical protein ACR2NX_05910 [Chthoniobacterales bacterium]
MSSVANDGVVDLQVYSIDAVVPHRGETIFAFKEKMRLRETPTGLRAELVSIRKVLEPD